MFGGHVAQKNTRMTFLELFKSTLLPHVQWQVNRSYYVLV